MMVDFRRSRTREVGVVLVLALLVVDGVLVVMALRNQPEPPTVTVMDDPPPATPTESPTSTPATTSPTPSPTTTSPTPTPTAEPTDPGTPRELPLSVLNELTAVRGTPGSCAEGDGSVEITEDGGGEWTAFDIPELAVLRVRVTDDDLWFIGADEDCLADLYRGGEEDGNWDSSGSTRGAWHMLGDPNLPEVHAPPDNFLPGPCGRVGATVVELESAVGAPARVLCSDGSVHMTNDGPRWDSVGVVAGARALGISDGRPLVAATGVEGCDGLAVQEPTPERPTSVGCVEGAAADGVALSFADDQVGFLLAGGATWTTADGGETWDEAGAA
jgi:hypothetical protein